MEDDVVAVRAAVDLGRKPYHQLNPALHLRLLYILCLDVVCTLNCTDALMH
jgi:hypothetical protein